MPLGGRHFWNSGSRWLSFTKKVNPGVQGGKECAQAIWMPLVPSPGTTCLLEEVLSRCLRVEGRQRGCGPPVLILD